MIIPIKKSTLQLFRGTITFLSTCNKLLFVCYILMPVIFMLYQVLVKVRPVILLLPYPGINPANVTDNIFVFAIMYTVECVNVIVTASTSLGLDSFFALSVFQVSIILNTMSHKVTEARDRKDTLRALRNYIDKHNEVMGYVLQLESTYALIMFTQRLTDAIVLCAVIFQMQEVRLFG
uniref:Odorant receptor n=1 Tax=Bracon brevicornis TaxID=1563983 RepID=A0A6V7LF34_9HYME